MSHKLSQRAVPPTQRRPWGSRPNRCAMWPPMTSATNRIAASGRTKTVIAVASRALSWSAAALDAFAGDRDDDSQDQDQAEEQTDVAEHVKQRRAAGARGGR